MSSSQPGLQHETLSQTDKEEPQTQVKGVWTNPPQPCCIRNLTGELGVAACPVNAALGKLRQEDHLEFQVSVNYVFYPKLQSDWGSCTGDIHPRRGVCMYFYFKCTSILLSTHRV